MTATRCARKYARHVVGGTRALAVAKVVARRNARREGRAALRDFARGADADDGFDFAPRRLTGRDVS